MQYFILCFEIMGTIAFALSGAMTGLKKNMDLFGTCILGITTAVGGGVIRDLILGITPPTAFLNPRYILVAMGVSICVFIPQVRRILSSSRKLYENTAFLADSAGLGIFTVFGVEVARISGYADNFFLVIFVAVVTGVGGGVMRDIFAGDKPHIFVKHIYACAAIVGAIVCQLLCEVTSLDVSMAAGFAVIVVIRILSAKYRLNLPHAEEFRYVDDKRGGQIS